MTTRAPLYGLSLALAMTIAALAPAARAASPEERPPPAARESPMSFRLVSPAFPPDGDIPPAHTCDGKDVSPPLQWSATPAGTRSLALVVDDPDAPDPAAPRVVWVHWVLYNIPAQPGALPAGLTAKTLPAGTLEGLNDWKQTGWRGPCPPVGRHRYFFKLYALDAALPDLKRPTKAALEKAMEGHVLARAELVGRYERH